MNFRKKNIQSKNILVILSVVVVATAVYLNFKKAEVSEPDVVVQKLSKLMVLPTDEIPTVATVTNLEPLKDNSFFKNAVLGDKIILYARSEKAILYRIGENKIIEIGPINMMK